MRRRLVILSLLAVLVLAGCVPAFTVPTPAPGGITAAVPTLPDATAPAATQPAATLPPAETPAAPDTAVPAATATTAPAATSAVETPSVATAVAGPGAPVTYTSPALAISFSYLPQQDGQKIGVQETGDKIFVFPATLPADQGQYVQVYQKAANESLEDAIRRQVLAGYSAQDCPVVGVANPDAGPARPATYSYAQIQVPRSADDTPETIQAKAEKCPQPYAAVGGLAYFMADSAHPDRFVFFSIGQYAILASPGVPWQTTLRFTGAPGSTASGGGAAAPGAGTPESSAAGTLPAYMDDRSGPTEVVESLFNAINRKEYARAYAYWSSPAGSQDGPPPFDKFAQGYGDTAAVDLTTGAVTSGVGAGQIYYTVPVALVAHKTAGGAQTYAGCYVLHLARPEIQDAVPFRPLGIERGRLQAVPAGGNVASVQTAACGDLPTGQPVSPTPIYDPADISAGRYLDDRSGPEEVLRSLFNAINRKEYARAYSYWQTPGGAPGGPPPYDQFKQGYAQTASVQLTTGEVTSGVGAGQIYYQVPVLLEAATTGGAAQTFVGCYTLHLARPGIQTAPPFEPMGINTATVKQVANDAEVAPLMAQACK